MGKTHGGQRPSVLHQPFLNVLAVDLASRHQTAATVDDLTAATDPGLVVGVLDQFVARGNAAGPALAVVVEAELIHRGRIDSTETDTGITELDIVALGDFWNTGDVGGGGRGRKQKHEKRDHKIYQNPKR